MTGSDCWLSFAFNISYPNFGYQAKACFESISIRARKDAVHPLSTGAFVPVWEMNRTSL
ncbi:hypothetical protein JXJ21_11990 [candidate division KSB1 bacterium]|nr:hypothetical protein [candidate division KSB1 bacterium]